jgi:hypothetical protein
MKTSLRYTAAALVLASIGSTGFAEEPQSQPSTGQHQMGGNMGMGGMGGMGGMMGNMSDEQREEHIRQAQDHMLKMHELMNQILAAKDDKERERLKEEQRKLMREHQKQHQEMMRHHMQQMRQHGGGQMQHGGGQMQHGDGQMQHGTPAQ